MKTRTLITALGIVATVLPLQAQLVFNAAADFSTNQNPNGLWSYGWFPNTGTAFTLYPDVSTNPNAPGVQGWHTAGLDHPATRGVVGCNPTDGVICDEWGICLRPHSAVFHPGSSGERGVFRWTAPVAGTADIVAGFAPADWRATTDVHIWASGNRALFDGNVSGSGPGGSVEWRGSLAVEAGDNVDFLVGWGDIQRHWGQSTYVEATITLRPSQPDQPPRIWTQPAGETDYVSMTIRLDVLAVGTWPFAFQWFKDEVEIGGATNSTLVLPNVSLSATGDYTVVVSNTLGSVTSAVARVEVRPLPTDALVTGLVGYWPFDEGSGSSIMDLSGMANHGTLLREQPTTWAQGHLDTALYFDGESAAYVTVPSGESLRTFTNVTFAAWVRCNDLERDAPICAKEGPSGFSYWFGCFPSGKFGVLLNRDSGGWNLEDRDNGAIVKGRWTHLVSVWDGTYVRHYQDGERVAGDAGLIVGPLRTSDAAFTIGINSDWDGTRFKGVIDDVRIYKRALSAAEIRALYHYGGAENQPPVIWSQPVRQTAFVGDTVRLSALVMGTWPFTYQWRKDGDIAGATDRTLVLSNVTVAATGDYTVVVSNDFGSVTSEVARVTVTPRPSPLTLYVSVDSASPAYPYDTWATAAVNIQDAVDVAVAGDTVLVTNGVYGFGGRDANTVSVTNAIRLESVNGPAVTTINKQSGPGWCVYLGANSVLGGFTVTGGYGCFLAGPGGGVRCESSAVVTNCVITANVGSEAGGGVCGGTLYNCTISRNQTCGHNSNPPGGGAYRATLHGCRLIGNRAGIGPWGDGGSGAYECTLFNCHLEDNEATRCILHDCQLTACGGAHASTLYNCTLTGNYGGSEGTFYNCTVTDSQGGISGFAYNCILTGNANRSDGAFYDCTVVDNEGGISGTAYNSIVYYNSGVNYAEGTTLNYCLTSPLPTNGVGNITGPPLFMDIAAGDFRLREDSPCIDAGTNVLGLAWTCWSWNPNTGEEIWYQGSVTDPTDILGNTRFIDGNGDGIVAWDIGAYEFNSFRPPRFSVAPQLTADGWTLNITGAPNKWVSLERSGDLQDWEEIWSGFMWEETSQVATDDTGSPTFYRMVVP